MTVPYCSIKILTKLPYFLFNALYLFVLLSSCLLFIEEKANVGRQSTERANGMSLHLANLE